MRPHVQALAILIIATLVLTSNGRDCVDTVDVYQSGNSQSSNNRQVIVVGSDFRCNGRITGYLISLNLNGAPTGFPSIQVWRRSDTDPLEYTLQDTACVLTESDITMMNDGTSDYYLGNVSCTVDGRIKFQSGDIIGYNQNAPSRYSLGIINAVGYTSYSRNGPSRQLDTFNINNKRGTSNMQPLIQMIFDIRCDDLSAPANGGITSCSSGVGYEGDTCSFTCNTGYELSGSDTRICQSNGTWSGDDVVCIVISTSTSTTGIAQETSSNIMVTSNTVLSTTPTTSIIGITSNTMLNTSDVVTVSTPINSFTTSNNLKPSMTFATSISTDSAVINSFTTSNSLKSSMIFTASSSTDHDLSLISGFATSSSFESRTIFTTSSSTDFTQLTDAKQQNDDSGINNIGIIVGFIVAFIVFAVVVCVIIFLILYRIKKKKDSNCSNAADGYGSNDYHQYDKVNNETTYESPELPTHKNDETTNDALIANSVYYSSADKIVGELKEKPSAMPEMSTIHTTYHRKPQHGDYEALPMLDNCETSHYEMSDITDQCGVAIPSSNKDSTKDSIVDEPPSDNEQIYKDPGHKKEKIYEWFEKKKFRKLESDDIKILQELGSGEFGIVHLGLWLDSSTDPVQVAVKTLNSQCSESDKVRFLREAAIMGQFKHNNVVRLHGVVTDEENMMIAMEFMPKGDLREYLLNLKTTTPSDACNNLKHDLLSFCRQIAAGMDFLMSKKFVHRDLAARNMLLSNDFVCKIADFGMARDVADDTYYIITGGKFPLKWTAPEPLFYKKFSVRSDIWSFGCVMYEVWSLGHKPFDDIDGKQYVQKIITGCRLPPPPGCPRAIYELMIQCWHPTPRSRPTSGLILETLQKSDRALLTNSVLVKDDDLSQSMMLGAPLDEGSKLYLDLQQRYIS